MIIMETEKAESIEGVHFSPQHHADSKGKPEVLHTPPWDSSKHRCSTRTHCCYVGRHTTSYYRPTSIDHIARGRHVWLGRIGRTSRELSTSSTTTQPIDCSHHHPLSGTKSPCHMLSKSSQDRSKRCAHTSFLDGVPGMSMNLWPSPPSPLTLQILQHSNHQYSGYSVKGL